MGTDEKRLLFDDSPTSTLILTRDGTVADMNAAARKMLAMEPDRLIGRPVLVTVIPDDRPRVRDSFMRVLRGHRCEWTARFKRGDGSTRVQWVRAVPHTANHAVEMIAVFMRDITEGREGRPETQQLQALLENLPGQFAAMLDPAGRIRYSSGLARTHFVSDVDSIGLPFQDLLAPVEGAEAHVQEMLDAVNAGGHWGGVFWHSRADGVAFPVRVFATPYREPRRGQHLGILLAGRDVAAEQDWKERAQSLQRLAAVGEFVTDVAERLGDGLADLRCVMEDDPGAQTIVDRLERYASSVHGFADGTRGKPVGVPLTTVVTEEIERLRPRLEASCIHLAIDDDPDGEFTVVGHHAQLGTVARVLLENAVDSLEASGEKELVVTFASGPNGATFRVASPPGNEDREHLHRAFDPFFTTRPGHAGLGLTLARSIVQAHGGRIWSDSDEQGRNVFCVHLPFRGEESRIRFRPVPLSLSGTHAVLLVDDEEAVRSSIRRFLEKVGFEVREAWSGRSAVAQITAGHPPDMVLTDLRMSDGTGSWFLDQLSRDFPDLLRRTVIITGAPEDPEVVAIQARTGCRLLSKPIDLPHLLDLLAELATRE